MEPRNYYKEMRESGHEIRNSLEAALECSAGHKEMGERFSMVEEVAEGGDKEALNAAMVEFLEAATANGFNAGYEVAFRDALRTLKGK